MQERPERWGLFIVYCVTLGIAYLGVTLIGIAILVLSFSEGVSDPTMPFTAVVLILSGLALLIVTAAAPFLPRKKWAYTYHILLIALGVSSCLWWPIVIPLLITWVKPETREYYEVAYEDVFS